MFLNMIQDWAGWVLMLFSFGIVLMWKHVRSDTKVVNAIWFCLLLRHAVTLYNTYVSTVVGAGMDAVTMHKIGVAMAASEWDYGLGSGLIVYAHSLGFLYRAFGASFFFGDELSVLAFTLSCVVLVKLVDLLDMRPFRVGIILIFGLLPSAVIFMSVTLRESWQALFFLLSVYWAIRLRKRPSVLIGSFLLMSAFCLSLLHNYLSRYVICFILISIYWGILGRKKGVRWARHVRFLFAGLLVACLIILAQKMELLMTVEQILELSKGFRYGAVTFANARTFYGEMLDTSSMFGFVTTIPIVFVQYMFTPFPWQVENVKDIYALLESMLRFVLLFFAVYSWRRSSGEVRSYYSFLFIVVLGLELMWALGTVNWGTAMRHHVPGYSVIVLLGAPGLILFMRKLQFGIFGRGKVSDIL